MSLSMHSIYALLLLLVSAVFMMPSYAAIDVYDFDSARQEAQYRGLIDELRCPKCQNQNLASSDAPIAQDLKQKTYDMVKDGRSDAEIRSYMQERYGDFISYNPPVRPSTWILWFFPPLVLISVLGIWFWRNKGSRKPQVTTATSNSNSVSLSTEEQAALDRLLASRGATEVTKVTEAKKTANPSASKPSNKKPPNKKSSTKKPSGDNKPADDKGEPL